jgi:hypothetical protein
VADGIDFRMVTAPFTRFVDDRSRRMDRAAMWAVRQAGREVKKEARRAAPVLKDKNLVGVRQIRKQIRAGASAKEAYNTGRPIPGLLRDSIRSSRHLKKVGRHEYRLTVGPRSPRSILYAAKIEDRAHYMAKGAEAGQNVMPVIAGRAFNRVWKER